MSKGAHFDEQGKGHSSFNRVREQKTDFERVGIGSRQTIPYYLSERYAEGKQMTQHFSNFSTTYKYR